MDIPEAQIRVCDVIEQEVHTALPGLRSELVAHTERILNHGNKFRALLLMYTALCFGASPDDELIRTVAALEMLHRSTLIHDDLVDGDSERNGIEAIHAQFGPTEAVYIPTLVREHAEAMLPNQTLKTGLSAAWRDVALGQIMERQVGLSPDAFLADYNDVVRLKSAGFAQFALAAGHFFGTGEYDQIHGKQIGITAARLFQTVDDLQDMVDFKGSLPSDVEQGIKPAQWFFLNGSQKTRTGEALFRAMSAEGIRDKVVALSKTYKEGLTQEIEAWMPDNEYRAVIMATIEQRWKTRMAQVV